ncbi:MAG: right-handed parallel beta-helix repeat-containing protein [Bdellovibrio sp.]
MNTLFRSLSILCIQGFFFLSQAQATTYYVSTSGSDSNNGTSTSTPFRTISAGLSNAQSTGDIVYVMTGTYAETVSVDQSGITLSAYPNNAPVIDGGTSLPNRDWGVLISVNGSNNIVSGFEVRNSNRSGAYLGGYGIQVQGAHNTISKMNVHHTWSTGFIVDGDYNIVEDSSVSQATLNNSTNPGAQNWGSGLSAARNHSASALKPGITSYTIFRRNKVFDNWGEGLSCFEADHCTMEDNIVYDNWSTNIYISDATNCLAQRNMIYKSSDTGNPFGGTGISLADEVSSVPRSTNNIIINNFIYNAGIDAFSWTIVSGSGLTNALIANNTIVDGSLNTGNINSNSQIRNNIILGGNSSVTSSSGLTFSNNNWAVTPPAAASSTNVNGDPQIARTGSTSAGALTPAYFKIAASSPVINKAMPLNNVLTDFFNVTRGPAPDIGAYEFVSTSPSTLVLSAPTGLKIIN